MSQLTLFLLEFLYQYVSFYPCILLCCLPFTDTHMQSVRKIAVVFAFVCIPVAAFPSALYFYFGIGDTSPLVALVFMLGSFFYYRRTIDEGLDKLLFTFFLVASMVCMVSDIECATRSLTEGNAILGYSGSASDIFSFILLRLAAYLIIWRLINRFMNPRLRRIKSEDMKGIWLLPVAFTALCVYRVATFSHSGAIDFTYPALSIFFAVLSFAVYHLVLRLTDTVMTRSNLEVKFRQKELENQSLSSMNRIRTEFLHDMCHEMKAPLTVIATCIDFADQEIKAENVSLAEAGEALGIIRAETQRLGRMIDGMARLSGLDEISENRKRVDFAALLRLNAKKFIYLLEQKSIALSVETVPDMPDVFIEEDKLAKVVSNLMINAAEHTQNGRIEVAAGFDDEYITVCITDSGEGVAPDILTRVFERGVSGRGSTGYGLYICKTVVEAHGGTIELESENGKGCAVTFTIPVYGGQEAGHSL